MNKTQQTHDKLFQSLIYWIEQHQKTPEHLIAHCLIRTGAQIAHDFAPSSDDAQNLIDLALEDL